MNLKDLFGVGTKLDKNIVKNNHQFHCYNQNMDFVNRINQNVAKYWYPNEKMVVVPGSFNGRCYYSDCVGIVSY